jgi:hypothetical protein
VIRDFDLRRNRQARTPACSLLRASCPPPFGSVSLGATDQNRSRRFCQPFARTPLQNWLFAALTSAAGMPFLFSGPDMNIRRRKVKPDQPVSQSIKGGNLCNRPIRQVRFRNRGYKRTAVSSGRRIFTSLDF